MHRELRFILKIALFCAPLAIFIGFPIWVLYTSKEFMSDQEMVVHQTSDSAVLIGPAYTNPICYLSLHSELIDKPDIFILGSSRVQELRSDFFTHGVKAFTSSSCIQGIDHFRQFLQDIPDGQSPRVILVSLDQKMFDPNEASLGPITDALIQPLALSDVLVNWAKVYRDYFEGKFTIADLMHAKSDTIGLSAIASGEGFRQDGSRDLGTFIYQPDDSLFRIDHNLDNFKYSDTVSSAALHELNMFLAECKQRNIYVIGFLPPFDPITYGKLSLLSAKYAYLTLLPPDLRDMFKTYNFGFYNFTNPQVLGLTDKEMENSIHMTERGSLMMILKIAETDPVLRQLVDAGFLKAGLASRPEAEANVLQ